MIKKLSSRVVYENKWMTVLEDDVEFADGTKGIYGIVEKPDGALVIPRLAENEYVLVRLYRYTTATAQWEFPCGSVEDEPMQPEAIAHLELQEETGYTAKRMTYLGSPYAAYGYSKQRQHFYLAEELTAGEPHHEAGEVGMEMKTFSGEEIERMMLDGEITDIESIAAWGMLKMRGN